MSDFPKQVRRKNQSLDKMDKRLRALDATFEDVMRELAETLRTEDLTDCEVSIGSTFRQFGPFIYGYSISMDAKGNTYVREFGNVRLSKEQPDESAPFLADSREQLVDVINEPTQVRILAELSGVDKSVIRIAVAKDSVTIRATSRSRKYRKRLRLPTDVNPKTLKTRLNNGCLEITLRKLKVEDLRQANALPNRKIPD